jgi:GTP-binding protein
MQFVDEAVIHLKAGDGGNGCVAFRREAHVPRGGPSGGDGGDGGSIVLVADAQLSTLLDYKYRQHYKATRGEDGRNKDQYGRGGDDLVLRVPVGTVAHDAETGERLADLADDAARVVVARGGKGGQGNIHFATPWNRAPREATPGTAGEQRALRLELKLLADVGLLGYPNVGKSTFIARVSRARPKIADYPFTTLVPNLGVADLGDERHLVIADIPGLIEGAAAGAGLGHRFLKHVARTRVLLLILDTSALAGPDREPMRDFDVLNRELREYAPDLADRPQVVALGKIDITEVREALPRLREAFATRGLELRAFSAVSGEGVREVLEALWRTAHSAPRPG